LNGASGIVHTVLEDNVLGKEVAVVELDARLDRIRIYNLDNSRIKGDGDVIGIEVCDVVNAEFYGVAVGD